MEIPPLSGDPSPGLSLRLGKRDLLMVIGKGMEHKSLLNYFADTDIMAWILFNIIILVAIAIYTL